MSLDLDKRRRAMLSEMGIKLWQPATATPSAAPATASAPAAEVDIATRLNASPAVISAPTAPAPRAALGTPTGPVAQSANARAATPAPEDSEANAGPAWHIDPPQAVYPMPSEPASALRWLVLAELPIGATQAFDGEAGQLMDNMLRAAGMQRDAALDFAVVQRGHGADPGDVSQRLQDQVTALIASHQPSAVLVMGRLVAQALLPSTEPFAKRRGQPLSLAGCPLLLTYDATYLLRNLPEKARAWEDLCLARVMAAQASAA